MLRVCVRNTIGKNVHVNIRITSRGLTASSYLATITITHNLLNNHCELHYVWRALIYASLASQHKNIEIEVYGIAHHYLRRNICSFNKMSNHNHPQITQINTIFT